MKFLQTELIALDKEAEGPEQAIRAAGELLVQAGAVQAGYVEAMVESYRERGPYFVLAPGIALPHAKAEREGSEASVSLVRLQQPVRFGHQSNDPVDLVFALGSATDADHIGLLRKLTLLLNNPAHIEALRTAQEAADIQKLLADD